MLLNKSVLRAKSYIYYHRSLEKCIQDAYFECEICAFKAEGLWELKAHDSWLHKNKLRIFAKPFVNNLETNLLLLWA